ncbi:MULTISPECIES: hypothetical protein [unclassified Dolichospermum]|uniref:hypothetical protein n=1 Tax=unclassified Dolichospermum TaxID=2622029 RepID=UPI0014479709|nr:MULTISPECIES: hypothetical protein [unclassified Dolichospermum]MTJ17960.1 hypothetical protein [Dolichospermum sp. UHCC 0299]MTJ40716.1 hypothetical protein [Dolichospermum sp. UHCC 0406]
MLTEYVLNPDIFDTSCFTTPEECLAYFKNIVYVLQNDGALIRNLYNGKWFSYVKQMNNRHPSSKYILELIAKHKQMRDFKSINQTYPTNCIDWCNEAINSHSIEPIDGIFVTKNTKIEFKEQQLVTTIENPEKAKWWENRTSSIRVNREINSYLLHLKKILTISKSLMFIDPYFHPVARPGYFDFEKLIQAINRPDNPPLIEIHLCKIDCSIPEFEKSFIESRLANIIKNCGLTVEVFIWGEFADRYLISDIIGISLNKGFDVIDSGNPNILTTWKRLDRAIKDDIQSEFDPATKRHKLQRKFTVS